MNIKFQIKTLLLYVIFILSVIQITSCKKDVPSVNVYAPFLPKEYTIDLKYFGAFNVEYNTDWAYYVADHCTSRGMGDVNISGKSFNADIHFDQRYVRIDSLLFF